MPEEPQSTDQQNPESNMGSNPGQWSAPKMPETPMIEPKPEPEMLEEHSESMGMKSDFQTQPMSQPIASTPMAPAAKPKSNKMMMIILIVIIGLIVVGGGIYAYMTMTK